MTGTVVLLSEDIRVTVDGEDTWLNVDNFRGWQKERVVAWLRQALSLGWESAMARMRQVELEDMLAALAIERFCRAVCL